MGHSLQIHKEYYDLPVGVSQKMIVAPVLHNITTGKLPDRLQDCNLAFKEKTQEKTKKAVACTLTSGEYECDTSEEAGNTNGSKKGWLTPVKAEVYKEFGEKIMNNISIPRKIVKEFVDNNKILQDDNKDVDKTCSFLQHRMKKGVSPKFKKIMAKQH